MSYQVNYNYSINSTVTPDYSEVEIAKINNSFNKSSFSSFAKIVIPALICLTRPVLQRIEDLQNFSNQTYYGQENTQTHALGLYFSSQNETGAINMTETRQTIENTKDIEYISKTLDEIKDVLKTLPRKVDIENLELKIDVAIKNNTINNYKLIAGVLFTSIIAPLALLIIQHYFFN